jgi:hypothetical protein
LHGHFFTEFKYDYTSADNYGFFKRGANEESVVDSNTKKSKFVDDSEGSQCSSELANLGVELLEESGSTIKQSLLCVVFCAFYMIFYNPHNSVKTRSRMLEMAFQEL